MKAIGGIIGSIIVGVMVFLLTQGPPRWLHSADGPAGMPSAAASTNPPSRMHMSHPDVDVDRGHGDYKDVDVADYSECVRVCLAEDQCKAISFNRASLQCWMKDSVPTKTSRPGFTSAVKYSE